MAKGADYLACAGSRKFLDRADRNSFGIGRRIRTGVPRFADSGALAVENAESAVGADCVEDWSHLSGRGLLASLVMTVPRLIHNPEVLRKWPLFVNPLRNLAE